MGVKGKLVSQVSMKYPNGDAFPLFKNPSHIPDICPGTVQSVNLLAGQWGTLGSVILWNYTIDGKKVVMKEMVDAIDEQKKSITYKVMEGAMMEQYKEFKITTAVDSDGEDNLVTYTFEYEKKSEAAPEPRMLMDYSIALTKQIERHYLLVAN